MPMLLSALVRQSTNLELHDCQALADIRLSCPFTVQVNRSERPEPDFVLVDSLHDGP